jgi:hypothetical protein
MPYEIRNVKNGYKVCKKGSKRCYSNKPLPRSRAEGQLKALYASEADMEGGGFFQELLKKAFIGVSDMIVRPTGFDASQVKYGWLNKPIDMPSLEVLSKMVASTYKPENEFTKIEGYNLVVKTPTIAIFSVKKKPNLFIIALRGTAFTDLNDISADLGIVKTIVNDASTARNVRNSTRYTNDVETIKQFDGIVKHYYRIPKPVYYAVGHSLSGAIIDELLEDGLVSSAVSFNPAIERRMFAVPNKNHRVYLSCDILYNLLGKFITNGNLEVIQKDNPKGTDAGVIDTTKGSVECHSINSVVPLMSGKGIENNIDIMYKPMSFQDLISTSSSYGNDKFKPIGSGITSSIPVSAVSATQQPFVPVGQPVDAANAPPPFRTNIAVQTTPQQEAAVADAMRRANRYVLRNIGWSMFQPQVNTFRIQFNQVLTRDLASVFTNNYPDIPNDLAYLPPNQRDAYIVNMAPYVADQINRDFQNIQQRDRAYRLIRQNAAAPLPPPPRPRGRGPAPSHLWEQEDSDRPPAPSVSAEQRFNPNYRPEDYAVTGQPPFVASESAADPLIMRRALEYADDIATQAVPFNVPAGANVPDANDIMRYNNNFRGVLGQIGRRLGNMFNRALPGTDAYDLPDFLGSLMPQLRSQLLDTAVDNIVREFAAHLQNDSNDIQAAYRAMDTFLRQRGRGAKGRGFIDNALKVWKTAVDIPRALKEGRDPKNFWAQGGMLPRRRAAPNTDEEDEEVLDSANDWLYENETRETMVERDITIRNLTQQIHNVYHEAIQIQRPFTAQQRTQYIDRLKDLLTRLNLRLRLIYRRDRNDNSEGGVKGGVAHPNPAIQANPEHQKALKMMRELLVGVPRGDWVIQGPKYQELQNIYFNEGDTNSPNFQNETANVAFQAWKRRYAADPTVEDALSKVKTPRGRGFLHGLFSLTNPFLTAAYDVATGSAKGGMLPRRRSASEMEEERERLEAEDEEVLDEADNWLYQNPDTPQMRGDDDFLDRLTTDLEAAYHEAIELQRPLTARQRREHIVPIKRILGHIRSRLQLLIHLRRGGYPNAPAA